MSIFPIKWLGNWYPGKYYTKYLKGRRTLIFHLLYGLPALVLLISDQFEGVDWPPILAVFFSPEHVSAILAMLSVIGIILRVYTTTPIFQTEHPAEVKLKEVEKTIEEAKPVGFTESRDWQSGNVK